MYTLTFKVEGGGDVRISAVYGENILTAAINAGVVIDAPCSGNGTCGKCRLKLISGAAESVSSTKLSDEDFAENWRLACRSTVCGDAVLLVPKSAAEFRHGIRTADLASQSELETYYNAVVSLFNSGLNRGVTEKGVGLAVDIGTTTVTAALISLQNYDILAKASAGNGQIRFGADVINRIIQSSKPGGREKLKHAILKETLLPLIDTLCGQAKLSKQEITRAVIAGNTTMEHLFVGESAESIRLEPYVPAFLELHGKTAADVELPIMPHAPVIFAPNVGSYVGGDITAGVLPTLMWNSDEMTLFIDLGTNGELVFGNEDFLLCCACSAGPAFEGGDISCGMRATVGAIEGCEIDAETMEPKLEVIGGADENALGLCGSGLIDTISELFRTGIIDARGKYIREGERVVRDEYEAAYVLAFAEDSASSKNITLSETDIDNFIRAKGAIFSAIRTMLGSLDMDVSSIDKVIIAGGIGSGISIEKAISIGMLPALPRDKYSYIGNSSLTGACAMLISDSATDKVFEIGRNMTYLELSTYPGYMDEFVAACFLPHTDAGLFMEGN